MKIRDFLKIKGHTAITIGPNETVHVALQRLVENNIGALPVCDEDGVLLGIISERDLLRECLRHTSFMGKTRVQEVMTQDVAVGNPEDDLNYAATVMKKKRIRHLPIVIGQKLESIVSMRDIVDMQLEEAEAEVQYIGLIKKTHFGRPHLP
jgi:CBS domain-containing protein